MGIVRESISFTRHEDPKESLRIGKSAVFEQIIDMLKFDVLRGTARGEAGPKSLSDFSEKNAYAIDTRKFPGIYSENQDRPVFKDIMDSMLDKVKTFSPSKLEHNAAGWVIIFFILGRQDDLWNAPKNWLNDYTFNEFRRYDYKKTIEETKKLGPNKAFALAALRGERELTIWAVENGADNLDIKNNAAIQRACESGDIELVKLLLSKPQVNPAANTQDGKRYGQDDAQFCIRRAAKNGHLEVVKLLMKDNRVDPSYRENFSLAAALANQDVKMVKLLLTDSGVRHRISSMKDASQKRLQKMDEEGLLNEAVGFTRGGDVKANIGIGREKLIGDFIEEMNKELMMSRRQFTLSKEDKTGVFLKAIEVGRSEIVQLLLSDPAVNPAVRKNAPIAVAALHGNAEVVDILLKDERVNPADNHNEALYQAAKEGKIAVVKRLMEDPRVNPADAKESLDRDYNITYEDNYIIREAAANQHLEVIKELLKDPRVKIKKTIQLVDSKLSKQHHIPNALHNWSIILDYLINHHKAQEELTAKEITRIKERIISAKG